MGEYIELTQGKRAVVDPEDYELLKHKGFHFNKKIGYAQENSTKEYMHRMILDAGPTEYVDHKNGDKLDNRRSNIRICTNGQNNLNRRATKAKKASKYKGVYLHYPKRRGWGKAWRAMCQYRGQKHDLGLFKTERQAAIAYDKKIMQLCPEFARTNFGRGV